MKNGRLLINQLVDVGVGVIVIKQNLRLGQGLEDMTAKVMVTLFALFAEIEHDFISLRIKEALVGKKAKITQIAVTCKTARALRSLFNPN